MRPNIGISKCAVSSTERDISRGRQHTLNGTVTLADNTYDNQGRLSVKLLHGSATNNLTYAYNIRSWLTGITGTNFTQNLYYTDSVNATKCYNGNISSMTWKGSDNLVRGYKYTYDDLSRLATASYGETAAINTNLDRFTEKVSGYDKNGNITALQRYGQTAASAYGLIDNPTYTLNGNQLNRVDDAVTTSAYNNGFEFKNAVKQAGEYAYDANGNLTKDLNKGISSIQYNVLNLPSSITFGDGSITYLYSADGAKLRTIHKTGSVSTTTNLPGSGDVQHVKAVQLYIFNGTGSTATCVASEDVAWSAYFGNIPPTVTSTMRYRVKYSGLVNGNNYTFLAVGMDDISPATYGYPAAIVVGTTQLGNAIATLAGTESATWKNMRQSELFAGAAALTVSVYGTQGNVNLWRRVAGVMGWFTNVPTSISGTPVSSIRISLYTQQNKSVPLIERSKTPVFTDYMQNPVVTSGGQVLVEIPVSPATLPINILSSGSYVLPVPAPAPVNANDYTLKVELVTSGGTVLRSNRVTLSGTDDSNSSPGNGTGVIDPQGLYRFPIVANRFYGIGSSLTPINLGGTILSGSVRARIIRDMNEVKIGE